MSFELPKLPHFYERKLDNSTRAESKLEFNPEDDSGEVYTIDVIGTFIELALIRAGINIPKNTIYNWFKSRGFNWWEAFILTKLTVGSGKDIRVELEDLLRGKGGINFTDDGCLVRESDGKTLMCIQEILREV